MLLSFCAPARTFGQYNSKMLKFKTSSSPRPNFTCPFPFVAETCRRLVVIQGPRKPDARYEIGVKTKDAGGSAYGAQLKASRYLEKVTTLAIRDI